MEGESRPAVVVKKQKQRIREMAYKNLARDDLIVAVTPYECTLSLSLGHCVLFHALLRRALRVLQRKTRKCVSPQYFIFAQRPSRVGNRVYSIEFCRVASESPFHIMKHHDARRPLSETSLSLIKPVVRAALGAIKLRTSLALLFHSRHKARKPKRTDDVDKSDGTRPIHRF